MTHPTAITLASESLRLEVAPHLAGSWLGLWTANPDQPERWIPLTRLTPDATEALASACFLMAPWTNRIANARFPFNGRDIALNPNWPDGSAIHGFFYARPFRILDRSPVSLRLAADHTPTAPTTPQASGEWPWPCTCVITYELLGPTLTVRLALTNRSEEPMPAGFGLHPFFRRALDSAAPEARLTLPTTGRYPSEDCFPVGPAQQDDASRALAVGVDVERVAPLDDVFAGWSRRAEVRWPRARTSLIITADDPFAHVVVFAPAFDPDAPPNPSEAGDLPLTALVCVEPSTMVNNGLNLSEHPGIDAGVRALAPGATLEAAVMFHVEHHRHDGARDTRPPPGDHA